MRRAHFGRRQKTTTPTRAAIGFELIGITHYQCVFAYVTYLKAMQDRTYISYSDYLALIYQPASFISVSIKIISHTSR